MINVVCYDEALSWSIIKFLVTWTRSRTNELPNICFKFSVYFSQFIYWTSLRPDEWENCDVTSATVKNLWEKIIWQLVCTNLVWSMLNALDRHDCYLFCGVQKVVSGNDWNQSISTLLTYKISVATDLWVVWGDWNSQTHGKHLSWTEASLYFCRHSLNRKIQCHLQIS